MPGKNVRDWPISRDGRGAYHKRIAWLAGLPLRKGVKLWASTLEDIGTRLGDILLFRCRMVGRERACRTLCRYGARPIGGAGADGSFRSR